MRLDLASATSHVLRRGGPTVLEPADISRPEPLSWPVTVPTGDGAAAGEPETAFGFFYAPTNSAVTAPEGELPPVSAVAPQFAGRVPEGVLYCVRAALAAEFEM